jgi:hypothetical protein
MRGSSASWSFWSPHGRGRRGIFRPETGVLDSTDQEATGYGQLGSKPAPGVHYTLPNEADPNLPGACVFAPESSFPLYWVFLEASNEDGEWAIDGGIWD